MSANPVVSFARGPGSPLLDATFRGVIIRLGAAPSRGEPSSLSLHGAYQVTTGEAGVIGAIPLQRALVVTSVCGLLLESWNLVGETFTFEDDEVVAGGVVRGYFNTSLATHLTASPGKTGNVVVSLGPLLSNVVRVTRE